MREILPRQFPEDLDSRILLLSRPTGFWGSEGRIWFRFPCRHTVLRMVRGIPSVYVRCGEERDGGREVYPGCDQVEGHRPRVGVSGLWYGTLVTDRSGRISQSFVNQGLERWTNEGPRPPATSTKPSSCCGRWALTTARHPASFSLTIGQA